jgi:hypothetical protein
MNALQTPPPSLQPVRPPRSNPKLSQQKKRQHQRSLAIESSIKLTVNVVISGVAIAALGQLLPYSVAQHAKLREIRAEVKTTEGRVGRLKAEFHRYFDPRQAQAIMQEQTNRTDPNQRTIVWGEPPSETAAQLP